MAVWDFVIGGAVILAVIFGIGLILKWFSVGPFGDDETAEQGSQRIQRSQQTQQRQPGTETYRIPIRDKPKQLPMELKIMSVVMLLLAVVVGWYTYQFYQTGNPQEFAYAGQLQKVGLVSMGILAGVYYRGRKQNGWGRFTVLYESRDGDEIVDSETYYFDAKRAQTVNGNIYVQELWPTTILGVFRRRKLTGHERDLRGDRPLGDPVTHEIPEHAVKLGPNEYEFRTQGQDPVPAGKAKPADYEYTAPIKLPHEEHVRRSEQMRQLRSRNQSLSAQLAAVSNEFYDLKRLVENKEFHGRQDLLEEIKEIQKTVAASQHHYQLGGGYQPRRHPDAVNGGQGGQQTQQRRSQRRRGGDGR